MFQLVLNSIQKTVDVIAPQLDAEIEFKYHCETIKDYFLNEQNLNEIKTKLIEDTQIPKHLNEIMRLLLEDNERLFLSNKFDDNDQDETLASVQELNPTNDRNQEQINNQIDLNTEITISCFMECLLTNKILKIIINASKLDLPCGIREHCYRFLSRLLNDYKVNLLNHCSILNQINELISICAINSCPGPYEQTQIEFLSVIVNKIKLNYNLIHCFTRHDFPLLSSLIAMLSSPDSEIADKSGQLLIDLVSIIEDDVVKIILSRTLFKNKINDNLIYHYKQIPININPEDIETVLNFQDQNLNDSPQSLSYQIRKFFIFFKWFSFLDLVLIKCKSSILASNLLDVFRDDFLVKNLSDNLFVSEEKNLQILSTILTFACLKHCKSIKLKEKIINYLIDETNDVNNDGDQLDNETKDVNRNCDIKKRKILIDRCRIRVVEQVDHQFLFKLDLKNHIERLIYNDYLLSLYTLQLFEEILYKIDKKLFEQLFIENLIQRNYLDISRYNINNDLNELDDLNKITDLKLHLNDTSSNDEQTDNSKSLINNPAIRSIKFFFALLPNELKSCNSDFGFEPYIEEAQKRFDECLQICDGWRWPREVLDDYSDDGINENSFVENDFISMIFDNLNNIIKIPYELNLQVGF